MPKYGQEKLELIENIFTDKITGAFIPITKVVSEATDQNIEFVSKTPLLTILGNNGVSYTLSIDDLGNLNLNKVINNIDITITTFNDI